LKNDHSFILCRVLSISSRATVFQEKPESKENSKSKKLSAGTDFLNLK
jgi:hypothetical protein